MLTIKDKENIKTFENTKDGFESLLTWAQSLSSESFHFCMESTGKYGHALALHLYTNHQDVSMINPARIKYFMKGQLTRNKTDKADAKSIREYGDLFSPSLWQPLPGNIESLRALVRCSDVLTNMLIQEKNRLEKTEEIVLDSIKNPIDYIENEINSIQQDISKLIDNDEELKQNSELLKTIPGVGDKTTSIVLAFFNNIEQCSHPKQLAA